MTDPHPLDHDVADRLAQLDGLVSADTGITLAGLAAQVPRPQAIVEIGSFRGKSTAYLAAGAKAGNGALVHAVDPWDLAGNAPGRHGQYTDPATRAAFESQLRSVRLWSKVAPIQGFSSVVALAWDGPLVGLLFIDGGHTYEEVLVDFAAWRPHLAESCVVVFDDIDTPKNPGVRQFVDELPADSWAVELAPTNLAVARPC